MGPRITDIEYPDYPRAGTCPNADTKAGKGGLYGMTRLSLKEARRLGINLPPSKKSKYGARKVEVDGITFDSKKEANKYCELKMLKAAGKITGFELQPEFILQEGFRDKGGTWVRPIKYRADFKVYYPDGRAVVIDTKGFRTKEYLLKKKILLYKYPNIEFVEE